ncbi:MAG: ATP-binding cassette domain-containing protein [Chloroflexi bacterium]|nr:ATP-binding cassette domain-containing protein [Chloroflexota bacterium]
MNEDFLVAPNLHEGFDSAQAVDSGSVSIGRQDIFGLLGPNTAGKTTTLRILSTVQRPDSGDVTIGGHSLLRDSHRVRQLIGSCHQDIGLYSESSLIDNLAFFGKTGDLRGAEVKTTASESTTAVGLSPSIPRLDSRGRSVTRT